MVRQDKGLPRLTQGLDVAPELPHVLGLVLIAEEDTPQGIHN